MAERSGRLDLIGRAGKRLGALGDAIPTRDPLDAVPALQPTHDGGVIAELESARPATTAQTPELPLNDSIAQTSTLAAVTRAVTEESPAPAPTLGTSEPARIARIKFNEVRRRGMITPDNLRSNISFEFRAIKRKLLAGVRDQRSNGLGNNLIMVTSALPGEGKTFTASNLAIALTAERDLDVLLIDADVIRPSIGALFDHPQGPGLTDLLNGNRSDVADVTHQCEDIQNLEIIFAGAHDERTPELISSQRTADLLTELSERQNDRIVIFDTPPALASAETANLAAYMHHVILVVAWGEANRHHVQKALDNVSACRNVSLIFNKAPKWQKLSSDYYYYYSDDRNVDKP
jgi:protein-tyrosine kinase